MIGQGVLMSLHTAFAVIPVLTYLLAGVMLAAAGLPGRDTRSAQRGHAHCVYRHPDLPAGPVV